LSLVGPKARPQGVVDGSLVDIPEPGYDVEYTGTLVRGFTWCWFQGVLAQERSLRAMRTKRRMGHEKPCRSRSSTVPQTDTGGRVEDTKAFEITIVKELGKIAP